MRRIGKVGFGALALLGLITSSAQAGGSWSVGVRIGTPVYPRPYYHYYRPYPVYVAPRPVYFEPVPVYVTPPPVVVQPQLVQPPPVETAPVPRPVPARTVATDATHADIDRHLRLLADPGEQVRIDSVTQLGRYKAQRAIDPLAATLSGDSSPAVREAAARALGIIGSPKALPALQYAAQADSDRDVRHSARFAAEVIQSNR